MLTLLCLAPLTAFAEQQTMSTQQQCAEYGVYQDASGNWVECAGSNDSNERYLEDSYADDSYAEEPYKEEPNEEDKYTEDSYIEESYSEEPYVEPAYVEESYVE